MSLSAQDLEALKSHWAIEAIKSGDVERAETLVNERLVEKAVGQQISFDFLHSLLDEPLLERAALAYEIAAIEGLDELSRPAGEDDAKRSLAVAAAFKAFEIRRLLRVPNETHNRLYFVIHLSALAYCGDRWSDLRRWYKDNPDSLEAPSVANVSWDMRLLFRLFDCWVRLFRKQNWDDLDRIREIIAGLREDQGQFEENSLASGSVAADQAMALRLVALYHWAKGTEILALYMLQGEPANPFGQFDRHFEAGIRAASASGDAQHELILRWLHAAARIMVTNSLWRAARAVNSRTTKFVQSLTSREHRPMFELLPPQRTALLEQGLLDQAKTAIVIDMPTSGGKTLLAQFRILQALNQFEEVKGWVAYVTPTRALSAQITRNLKRDFGPIGVQVEQLTAAVEVDAYEETLLSDQEQPFHILVATPEKLSLLVRNKKVERPLALVVMDEAHNLETEGRGLRFELLLATIKRDCPNANFLLLMPFVENANTIARWLAQDIDAGHAISLSTTPWKPNERIVGLFHAVPDDSETAGWHLAFETLTVTEKSMHLQGTHKVGGVKPLDIPKSRVLSKAKQRGLSLQTAAIGVVMSTRGTSIVVGRKLDDVWNMARHARDNLPILETGNNDIQIVKDFLQAEFGPTFELIDMLDHGVGVHHAGLSDEVRALMEWLAESATLRVLCATSTISQGINFPVSSVFLASRSVPQSLGSKDMTARDFWNLAGRAGRIGHDSVGVVGLAKGAERDGQVEFISRNTGALVSRLVTLLENLAKQKDVAKLHENLWEDQWEDFRCYITHYWLQKKNLDATLADSEQLLRQTYGYYTLRNSPDKKSMADALLEATRFYVRKLAEMPAGIPTLADSTGFSPEGVQAALHELGGLEGKLKPSDWAPESLFGEAGRMADLFGVMLAVPQLKRSLSDISGQGNIHTRIANITRDWVNGKGIQQIAKEYFSKESDTDDTKALSTTCRAIYRSVVNSGTWGISALSQLDLGLGELTETEKKRINALPAMIYHGVNSEEAVLMRMNAVPRSVANGLGKLYRELTGSDESQYSIGNAREFLKQLNTEDWGSTRPVNAALSGEGYKRIWGILSGESV